MFRNPTLNNLVDNDYKMAKVNSGIIWIVFEKINAGFFYQL